MVCWPKYNKRTLTIKKLTETTSQTYIIQEEAFAKTHLLRPKCSEMAALTMMDVLMTTLRGATDAEMLAFMQLLNDRGIPLFNAGEEARAPEPKAEEPKEPKAKKEPKEEVPMPVAVDGAAPEASAYRIAAVDLTTCVGRGKDDDKRWSPIVFRERQCGKKVVDGCDLCTTCAKRAEKNVDMTVPGGWLGRVTDEPPSWMHMLGTAWAEKAKPKFNASAPVPSPSPVSSPVADKEAKKAAAEAKKAEKEAKKAEAAAEKEAKKAAAAAKKAEKEAKKAVAEAKKAEKAEKPKKEVKAEAKAKAE